MLVGLAVEVVFPNTRHPFENGPKVMSVLKAIHKYVGVL
jgi:hypothetical protein